MLGYILFGPEASNSLNGDLANAESKYQSLVVELDSDKNESDLALSTLYRTRVDFRDKEEELQSKIQNLESEISGFTPKLAEFEKEISSRSEEFSILDEKLTNAREPMEEIIEEKLPFEKKKKSVEEELGKLTQSLATAKRESDLVDNNFKNLEIKRKMARENFEEELGRLMAGIKKPYHFYYTEKKDVLVTNRAPSGKGIFINHGYEEGMRENMEFITKNENATSELSFRLKATLVQKKFSFLEFLNPLQTKDPSFASNGQNLRLTRSGESLIENDSDPENSIVE